MSPPSDAAAWLRRLLAPGDTVYTAEYQPVRKGRVIGVAVLARDSQGAPYTAKPNHVVALALGAPLHRSGRGLITDGDGASIVRALGRVLYNSETALQHYEL